MEIKGNGDRKRRKESEEREDAGQDRKRESLITLKVQFTKNAR